MRLSLFLAAALASAAVAQNFDGHDFRGESLAGRDLRGAHLHGARGFGDMSGADLRGAHLEGADLSTARNLDRANVLDACYDARTKWPADADPRAMMSPAAVSSSGGGANPGGMPAGIR